MERVSVLEAKKIFKNSFLGYEELKPFFEEIGLVDSNFIVPDITYSREQLECSANNYILVLGVPYINDKQISIRLLREHFGLNPAVSEPCFYNQDWYLSEEFIDRTVNFGWYLLKKNIIENSRAVTPEKLLSMGFVFPSAILCTYTFFAYYCKYRSYLWLHDFVWCCDVDHNGDRIYVGKYNDVDGINKNGFSIHRHLALRSCYGVADLR